MAKGSFTKQQTANRGSVALDFSFPSGAAEDGSFPAGLLGDGYIGTSTGTTPDAYGGRSKGLNRVDVGEYELLLNQVFVKCISFTGCVESQDAKAAFIQAFTPVHDIITGTDNKKYSRLRFRVINGSGNVVDLAAPDRIHLSAKMNNSLGNET